MYENLAKFYDILIEDFPHKKIFGFLDGKIDFSAKKVLDLCCGTGKSLTEILNRNALAVGLDYSEEMLNQARNNLKNKNVKLVYGDINNLTINNKYDIITMICDGLNYLLPKNFDAFLDKVNALLDKNGVFVCDFSSLYKGENILGEELYYQDDEDITYFFSNKFNKKGKYTDITLTIFEKDGEKYNRYDDIQRQYFIENQKIIDSFKNRFDCEFYDGLKFKQLQDNSERILIIARKIDG